MSVVHILARVLCRSGHLLLPTGILLTVWRKEAAVGGVKRLLEEQEAGDYSYEGDDHVCAGCVTDQCLADVLSSAALPNADCSYCGRRGAAPLDALLEQIDGAVNAYWNNPVEELPWDGREDGYQGYTLDGYDLIMDELNDWTENDQLREDVAEAFRGSFWCERGFFALSRYEALQCGWASFVEQVKHKTRFLFFAPESEEEFHVDETDGVRPERILDALGELFREYQTFQVLDAGTTLYRARVGAPGSYFPCAKELGTAPRELATQPNRMSPAGIPMFYGAFDPRVAVKEAYDPSSNDGTAREIIVARFTSTRPLHVLDLTRLPPIPSVFDGASRHCRDPILFLHAFAGDLSQPIERDSRAHAEYAPTQVVTEYVRYRLQHPSGSAVDGIIYESASVPGHAAVIFADPEHCGPRPDQKPSDPEPFLRFTSHEVAPPPTP